MTQYIYNINNRCMSFITQWLNFFFNKAGAILNSCVSLLNGIAQGKDMMAKNVSMMDEITDSQLGQLDEEKIMEER